MEPPAWAFLVSLVVNLAAAAADFDYAHTFPGHKIAPRPAKTGGGANFAAVSRRRKIFWPHPAPHSATSATFPAPCAVWGCNRAGGEPPPPAHVTTPAGTTFRILPNPRTLRPSRGAAKYFCSISDTIPTQVRHGPRLVRFWGATDDFKKKFLCVRRPLRTSYNCATEHPFFLPVF